MKMYNLLNLINILLEVEFNQIDLLINDFYYKLIRNKFKLVIFYITFLIYLKNQFITQFILNIHKHFNKKNPNEDEFFNNHPNNHFNSINNLYNFLCNKFPFFTYNRLYI